MNDSSLKKILRICMVCFAIAFVVFIGGGIWLISDHQKGTENKQETQGVPQNTPSPSQPLADEMVNYPGNIQLNQEMPELVLYKENGETVKLSDFKGKNVIFLFWTSWCKNCNQELKFLKEYEASNQQDENVEFILLNKLDGEKETKENALSYFKENNMPFTPYFDEGLAIYNQLGIKTIPTMLGIDAQGRLKVCKAGKIDGTESLSAFVDYVKYGGAYGTEQFITKHLTGADGGIHVNYQESNRPSPSGYDVISESQGIMMEYAVLKQDKELFDRNFNYVSQKMLISNALAGWVVTKEGSSMVNSVVDDLRIYKALYKANQLWGGYDQMIGQWEKSILKYNTKSKRLTDNYDFKFKKKAERLTLCFADFEALQLLGKSEAEYNAVYNNALNLVKGGLISSEFPLYYSWYDYKKNQYKKDHLNMAEAMYTLLNLARAGELRDETVQWMKKTIENGGIKAYYTTDGQVEEGYNYESAAVYAMIAMIAEEINDSQLLTDAIARMERMRIYDKSSDLNGALGSKDGKDIYSFDQCMVLLAYGLIER